MSGEPSFHHSLDIPPDSVAASAYKNDAATVQALWQAIQKNTPEGADRYTEDFSEGAETRLLAGKDNTILAKDKPIYWAVKDNRVYFSHYHQLGDEEKMQIANQVLATVVQRSNDPDTKVAALSATEKGDFFIATNGRENATDALPGIHAEANVKTIMQELGRRNEGELHLRGDSVKRLFIMGGLIEKESGRFKGNVHSIRMCNDCMEKTKPLMSDDSLIVMIPANDGSKSFNIKVANNLAEVSEKEAWQVRYNELTKYMTYERSDTRFAKDKAIWEAIKEGGITRPEANIEEGSLAWINQQMLAKLVADYRLTQENDSPANFDHFVAVLIEYEDGSNHKSFAPLIIDKNGEHYNATTPPATTAVGADQIAKPRTENAKHISNVYVMAHDQQHPTVEMHMGQWGVVAKRAGQAHFGDVAIRFLPLNEGGLTEEELDACIDKRPLIDMVPTAFLGSSQHPCR